MVVPTKTLATPMNQWYIIIIVVHTLPLKLFSLSQALHLTQPLTHNNHPSYFITSYMDKKYKYLTRISTRVGMVMWEWCSDVIPTSWSALFATPLHTHSLLHLSCNNDILFISITW